VTKKSRRVFLGITTLATALALSPSSRAADAKSRDSAKIEVKGMGWWDDREQRNSLARLLGSERGETLDANAIEDAVFLLLSSLTEEGYLEPKIEAVLVGTDGQVTRMTYDSKLESFLPRTAVAKSVTLLVDEGVRFVFDDVRFTGLRVLQEEVARQFFMGEPVLISRKAARVYSPSKLRHALGNLEQELQRLGYADARVTTKNLSVDRATGKVRVEVAVEQGARWLVTSVRLEGAEAENNKIPALQNFTGQAWSPLWQQNVTTELRNHFWHLGFPDVTVQIRPEAGDAVAGVKAVAVTAQVKPGEAVKVGPVHFVGARKTSEAVLRRRVAADPGQPLDPLAIEQARFRLARLGIFDSVDLRYEPGTGPERSPIFRVRERRQSEVNLLLGYGSYEQVRGGVEWRQWNLFGRAHQSRLLLLQSMKSSRGEYSYTVPELFGESLDGTARLFGLQRQETSFLRQEFGGSFAVSTPVKWLGANASLGYTYQSLRNRDNTLATRSADESQVNAASVDLNLVRDRRDNPLRPRRGYRWFLQTETASQLFGGSVDYQRIEFGGSYHARWGQGRWVHVGLNHGLVTTIGTNDATLPVNKRFFPGGDNSIRGYQDGEAAPIDSSGKFVGAKSYLLLNLEVEQALTNKWSAVIFGDALGTAVRLADYPFDETLYSLGIGLRYQTIIGPLRIEYGRNLDPRPRDPSGSLLFSVGFPF
jgi:outer membrane protein assembly complex protein YaeT